MKFNKWTLGLAAVGAVSMASAVRADEAPKMSQVQTALSATTLSGYVDVAAQYNLGNPSKTSLTTPVAYGIGATTAATAGGIKDGFSLNDVDIALDKPLDDSPWASGYHVELNAGQDGLGEVAAAGGAAGGAGGLNGGIRQAYVTMRTPVGSGITWKFGAFDGITGYEGNTGYSNPNYTRSYGWAINPASQVGLLGSYTICSAISLQAGIVNRDAASSNPSGVGHEVSSKSYVALLTLTAPDSWGWIKGSALNVGTIQTFDAYGQNNYTASLTLNTPVTGLKGGLAYDHIQALAGFNGGYGVDGSVYGIYATYQQTDKLSYNARAEYIDFPTAGFNFYPGIPFGSQGEEVTVDVEYDLWANMTTRVEGRWDHDEHFTVFNQNGTQNAFLLALNLVYKF